METQIGSRGEDFQRLWGSAIFCVCSLLGAASDGLQRGIGALNSWEPEEYLSFAFRNCLRSCQKNKRMILIYLLPVKMLLGHMPTIHLLRKYDLMQFADVTKAVSEGNLLLLTEALTKHETFFIRCGIFLILEKLKIITYRNLFKKVYLLLRTHQLSLDAFLVALKFMKVEDVDIDEVNSIVANLIYMGHIKGYISHQHQKLVVSKQNPFPSLSKIEV